MRGHGGGEHCSALLGRDLEPRSTLTESWCACEYARAGLDNFERHVGRRTTCHVVRAGSAEFMEDEKMLEALEEDADDVMDATDGVGELDSVRSVRRLLLSNSEADGPSSRGASGDRWCCLPVGFLLNVEVLQAARQSVFGL